METLTALFVKLKLWGLMLYKRTDAKFREQFGFRIKEITYGKVVGYLYAPKDSSSLAITRILFGLAMLFDIPDERGGSTMEKRWGEPMVCHFPLVPFVRAVPMPYMAVVYAALWMGAIGITFGYKYRSSATLFTVCYWYLFLIEKSFWNNHSYLFGLVALLLACTEANCYWSLDVHLDSSKRKQTVPYWNYFILKYQFFILYFMAGLKKGTAEWLTGYSVQNLSEHWVFNPFKIFLSTAQTDYLVVHWFVFGFDLTVALWMMWSRTRHVAMVFCALFHLMNSRLFKIGMFPWVCLATMPLFYPFDWIKMITNSAEKQAKKVKRKIRKFLSKFILNNILIPRTDIEIRPPKISDQSNLQLLNNVTHKREIEELSGHAIEENDQEPKNVYKRMVKCKSLDHEIREKTVHGIQRYEVFDQLFKEIADRAIQKQNTCDRQTKGQSDNNDNDDTKFVKNNAEDIIEKHSQMDDVKKFDENRNHGRKNLTFALIAFYVIIQAFLPYSHFITKGYNNWTKGLYGYSWDMMVHTWELDSVVIKVVNNTNQEEYYLDPYIYSPNDRWTRHGDMVHQYARCLKDNLIKQLEKRNEFSHNISIYVDVWCSMNGRFTQRMFDPKVDLLNVSWSPLEPMSYVMPLLDEALDWRADLQEMKTKVHSWSNYSDVTFFADFPGYDHEKYIPPELSNVSLTVLNGTVAFEPEVSKYYTAQSYKFTKGDHIKLDSGTFHRIINTGTHPAFYMYTFANTSDASHIEDTPPKPKLPIGEELFRRLKNMAKFMYIVLTNTIQVFSQAKVCK